MTEVAVSAHRGGSEYGIPGTYQAYYSAISIGADYVELDVRKTRDGKLIAMHDDRAKGTGTRVSDSTHSELSRELGYEVPLVSDILLQMAGKALGHLDIKETGFERDIAELAIKVLGVNGFIITTLEDKSIARIKADFPDICTALSLGRDLTSIPKRQWLAIRLSELFPISRVRACGADWVAVNYKLALAGVLAQCRRHDIGTMVWTVNSRRLLTRFFTKSRTCVVITDRPAFALQLRKEMRGGNPAERQSSMTGGEVDC